MTLTMVSCSSMKVVEYSIKSTPNILLSETAPVTLLYNVNSISTCDNQTNFNINDSIAQYIYSSISDKLKSSDKAYTLNEIIVESPTSKALKTKEAEKYNREGNNIISLNRVTINPYYRSGTIDDDWHFVDLLIPTELHLSISSPQIDSIVSYSCVDTLIFSGAGYTKEEAINSLPLHKDCINDVVENITKIAAMQYQAHNENYARIYFVSFNRMMHKADKFWREGKYDEASYIWNYLYENKRSKKIQARTAANMAMYEELKHNFDKSLMWARISFALFSRRKSVFDPEIAYLSDYIQQLRLDLKEQQNSIKNCIYIFD